ncbi:carboxypeptidase-like regulatory domain-containing protein [Candidatus Bipolaricaulota bacterium]
MSRNTIIAVAALFVLLMTSAAVSAQADAVIEGQVLSATVGDQPIGGAIVTLLRWAGDEGLPPAEMITGEDGGYSFAGLEPIDHEYQLIVVHQEITYRFGRKTFAPGETALSIPLTVYDTTTDESVIAIDRAHVIIDGDAEHLHVQEVHILNNTSLATYVPRNLETGEGVLRFLLPDGAANPEWLGGFPSGSVGISEGGFHMDAPFLPGTAEVTFSYTLPFSISPDTVEKTFAYPVGHLDVFVTATGIEASAPLLVREDPIAMQAGHYHRFSADELPANTSVALELERADGGQQAATPEFSPASGPGATTVIIIVVVIVLVLLVLVYPFIRRSRRKTD